MRQIMQPRSIFRAASTSAALYRYAHRATDGHDRKECNARHRSTSWRELCLLVLQRLTAPSVFESAKSSCA